MFQIKKIAFFFLFVMSIYAYNQSLQHRKDSITSLLKETINDSLFVEYNMNLGILTDTSDPICAERHFNNALLKLNANYTFTNKYKMIALAYDCIGIIERRRNNYDKALEFYLKALKVKEQAKDSSKIGRSYHNIAMLFATQRNYNKAISYMELALPMRINDSINYGVSLQNYGNFYYRKKEYDKAIQILDSATLFLKDDVIHLTDVNTIYARIYRAKKQYKKALVILEKNLIVYTKFEKLERKANTLKSIASCYRKLKNYTNALIYLDSTELLAKKYDNKKLIYQIYLGRYKIFKAKKEYKSALANYRIYKKYSDSVFTLKQTEKITVLELEFKRDKKAIVEKLNYEANERYLLTINKSQRSQKWLYAILFFLSLISLIALYFVYRYKNITTNESLKKQTVETELLNEQIVFLQYKIDRFLADERMRIDFKNDLIQQVKGLKVESNSKELLNKYQSLLIQLENQKKTEKRLNSTTKISDILNNDGFELKLGKRFPQLTKSEREICHLIYLNLSMKEIMNIRNVTLPSIKSARYRIRKKLAVPKGKELELFIQNLF